MPPARTRGSITLELVIAFAVLSLALTASILAVGSNTKTALLEESAERVFAATLVADTRHEAAADFLSVVSTSSQLFLDGYPFDVHESVVDRTGCLKLVTVSAKPMGGTSAGFLGAEWFSDSAESLRLGGDCESAPPKAEWSSIPTPANYPYPGAATAIDVVGDTVYVGLSSPPYVAVFDAQTWIPSTNGFSLPAPPSAIDAIVISSDSDTERYVYAALATSTGQFGVIDVTHPDAPLLTQVRSLARVTAGSDAAFGYHARYYDKRVYVTTEYIIGAQPELHIFDATDPAHPTEIGQGINIDTTINDFQVRTEMRSGSLRTYLYAATTNPGKELAVYDVTNPSAVPATPIAVADFGADGGGKGGKSLSVRGNFLYFGRASNTDGPEFYIFDIAKLTPKLVPIGSGEVSQKDVAQIVLAGSRTFLSAAFTETSSTRRIELWDVSSSTDPVRLAQDPVPGIVPQGLDFASDTLFMAAESDPILRTFTLP